MADTKDDRQTLEPETPGASRDAEVTQAPDDQSSTSAEYALAAGDVKRSLALVQDRSVPIADRAPVYAGLRLLKLYIDRAIRETGRELQAHLVELSRETGKVQYGPLRLGWRAQDVKWPVNERGNWTDDVVQQLLAEWEGTLNVDAERYGTDPIIVRVPQHYEVDTKALGAAVHAGSSTARAFHSALKQQRLRTEVARAATIEVVE